MTGITQIAPSSVDGTYVTVVSLAGTNLVFTLSDLSNVSVSLPDLLATLIASTDSTLILAINSVLSSCSIVNPSPGTEKNGDIKAIGDEGFFYVNGGWVQAYP